MGFKKIKTNQSKDPPHISFFCSTIRINDPYEGLRRIHADYEMVRLIRVSDIKCFLFYIS